MNVYFNGTWGTEQKYIYKCTSNVHVHMKNQARKRNLKKSS